MVLASSNRLAVGQVTSDDLVDEVLVRAWEEFDHCPAHWGLDVWLVSLLDEVVKGYLTIREEREEIEHALSELEPPQRLAFAHHVEAHDRQEACKRRGKGLQLTKGDGR